jgi:hypothetical protein
MTALVTSVVVEQPLRPDVRARPSFKRHARPFPAAAPQSAAALLLFTDPHSSLTALGEACADCGRGLLPGGPARNRIFAGFFT